MSPMSVNTTVVKDTIHAIGIKTPLVNLRYKVLGSFLRLHQSHLQFAMQFKITSSQEKYVFTVEDQRLQYLKYSLKLCIHI